MWRHPELLADLQKLRIVEKSYGMRLESPRRPSGHGDLACATTMSLFVSADALAP
jgi:hypothetical protein